MEWLPSCKIGLVIGEQVKLSSPALPTSYCRSLGRHLAMERDSSASLGWRTSTWEGAGRCWHTWHQPLGWGKREDRAMGTSHPGTTVGTEVGATRAPLPNLDLAALPLTNACLNSSPCSYSYPPPPIHREFPPIPKYIHVYVITQVQ